MRTRQEIIFEIKRAMMWLNRLQDPVRVAKETPESTAQTIETAYYILDEICTEKQHAHQLAQSVSHAQTPHAGAGNPRSLSEDDDTVDG